MYPSELCPSLLLTDAIWEKWLSREDRYTNQTFPVLVGAKQNSSLPVGRWPWGDHRPFLSQRTSLNVFRKQLLLLLLLSRLSRVWLCATPYMAAQKAPPSLGFSSQEHWSRLPFTSPMHETEKWKWSCSVMSNSSQLLGLQPTMLLSPWDFPGKSTGVGCHCLLC